MTGGFPAIQDAERKTTGWVIRWFFIWAIIINGYLYFCYLYAYSISDFCFFPLGFMLLIFIPFAILGDVYIFWNTVLTVLGVRICVQNKVGQLEDGRAVNRVSFIGKKGSIHTVGLDDGNEGQQMIFLFIAIALGFGGIALAIIQVIFEELDITTNTYSLVIFVASILFGGIYVYFLTSEGFSLKAETKFEGSVFTVGIIGATILAFLAIQSIVKFIVLQIVNSIEGYIMFVSILPIVIISIVIIIWRNRIFYSVIDMWIDVLEGNMKARSGESKNRFRRLFTAIKNRNKISDFHPKSSQPTVVQQWTDEAGHTWRTMDDGTTMWWNGTDWQLA